MIVRKCSGCGELLQTIDETKAGYTPILEEDTKYCRRCYRMLHYNELPKVLASNEDYEKVVDYALKQNGLMLYVIDIFAFANTFRPEIIDKLRNQDVILVINKLDLLPKSISVSNVVDFVAKECERLFFKVVAVCATSAKKGHYIDEVLDLVDMARRGRDVYVLGAANVGKSSFINAILKRATSRTTDLIATSIIPGTTLNEIIIPFFDDNKAIIDTPGLINPYDILEHVDSKSYNLIVPKSEIKPITYQVFGDYTYFIGALGYLKFIAAKNVSAIFYHSPNLKITRLKNEKLAEFIANKAGVTITPPTTKATYEKTIVKVQGRKNIYFAGFGFVTVIGNVEVEVGYLEHTEVKTYDGMLTGRNKESH